MKCKHSEVFQANVPSIHLSLVCSHGLKLPAPPTHCYAQVPSQVTCHFFFGFVWGFLGLGFFVCVFFFCVCVGLVFFLVHGNNLWVYRMITGGCHSGPMQHSAPALPRDPGPWPQGSSAGPFPQPSLGKGLAGHMQGGKH